MLLIYITVLPRALDKGKKKRLYKTLEQYLLSDQLKARSKHFSRPRYPSQLAVWLLLDYLGIDGKG